MADADLDIVIRQLAKQQNKSLMTALKSRRDRYLGLAAKAKDGETKQRYKQIAKNVMEHGTAAAKRLQMSADNAADSYARSVRMAAETPQPAKKAAKSPANKSTAEKPPANKSPAKKSSAKKAVKKAKG